MEGSSFSSPKNGAKSNAYLDLANEPKTLSHKELNVLRETALEVIRKYGYEEAGRIFMQGLKPLASEKPKPEARINGRWNSCFRF